MSLPTSLTILSITKTTKPRAARTSPTMEKIQMELLVNLTSLFLKYKMHMSVSVVSCSLKRLCASPKSPAAITRKIMANAYIAIAIICKSRLV